MHFSKSLNKIFSYALYISKLRSITFEAGTDLETLGENVFAGSDADALHAKGKMYRCFSHDGRVLELPRDFSPKDMESLITDLSRVTKIIFHRLPLPALSRFYFQEELQNDIIE